MSFANAGFVPVFWNWLDADQVTEGPNEIDLRE